MIRLDRGTWSSVAIPLGNSQDKKQCSRHTTAWCENMPVFHHIIMNIYTSMWTIYPKHSPFYFKFCTAYRSSTSGCFCTGAHPHTSHLFTIKCDLTFDSTPAARVGRWKTRSNPVFVFYASAGEESKDCCLGKNPMGSVWCDNNHRTCGKWVNWHVTLRHGRLRCREKEPQVLWL